MNLPENFQIREADALDSPDIARLIVQLGYAATPESIRIRLAAIHEQENYAVFLGTVSGKVVALALVHTALSLEHDEPHARLLGFVIDSVWRRKGIGRALMRCVEDWAVSRGAPFLTLSSGLHRNDAHGFYTELGYENTGVRFGKRLN